MRKLNEILQFSYPFILIIVLVSLFFFSNDKIVSFSIAVIGISIPAIKNIVDRQNETQKKAKNVRDLFKLLVDLIQYLESKEYWANKDNRDEKINAYITQFSDNSKELRRFFGYNIINEDRGQYNKIIILLQGEYKLSFRSHTPYECYINIKGAENGAERLYKSNKSAIQIKEQMLTEMKAKLKEQFRVKI